MRRNSVASPFHLDLDVNTPRHTLLLLLALALGACGPQRVERAAITDPALVRIVDAWSDAVDAAHRDPDTEWHAGWGGNFAVALGGEKRNAGRCTEWQELAYRAVRDVAPAVGWRVMMARINGQGPFEHDAVVVFDPEVLTVEHLFFVEPGDPAYILDGWVRGKADVYTLHEWSQNHGVLYRQLEVFCGDAEIKLRGEKSLVTSGRAPG